MAISRNSLQKREIRFAATPVALYAVLVVVLRFTRNDKMLIVSPHQTSPRGGFQQATDPLRRVRGDCRVRRSAVPPDRGRRPWRQAAPRPLAEPGSRSTGRAETIPQSGT